MLEHLFGQAAAAGVAGLTFSEHHGGVPGYVPTPIQVAGWVLDRITTVWSGPCPLRSSVLAAEELCWLAALHPGRVGAGFAPGHLASDFELVGADPTTRAGAFTRQLADVAEILSGNPSPMLEHDPAVALTRSHPIPSRSSLPQEASPPRVAPRAPAAGSSPTPWRHPPGPRSSSATTRTLRGGALRPQPAHLGGFTAHGAAPIPGVAVPLRV
ncbi:MAG: hypothetical protein ACPHDT_06985, partial [Acidimicrobiales bacterium]